MSRPFMMTAALTLAASALSAQKQTCPVVTGTKMPLTYKGGATVADITPCDLMTRLYIYAADSMRGREAGSPDAIRATAYIEREVRRLGLTPAGDKGTYFQYMPVTTRVVNASSTISAGGKTFHPNADFVVNGANAARKVAGDVIFGGVAGDTTNALTADQVRDKIVVLLPAAGGGRGFGGFGRGGGANNPLAS